MLVLLRKTPLLTYIGFTENEPINFWDEYFDNKYILRKNQTKYQPPVTP